MELFQMLNQGLKIAGTIAGAFISGWAAQAILLFQLPEKSFFAEHTPIVAIIVSSLFVFITRYYDNHVKRQETQDSGHATLTNNREDRTERQWNEVVDEKDKLFAAQIAFANNRTIMSQVGEYRSGLGKHLLRNEIGRLHGIIRELDSACRTSKPVPEYFLKYDNDLTEGIEEKVEAFRKQLEKPPTEIKAG